MQITYLGHAGFCVETKSSIIIMDPWLSKQGAFDSSWFQYPKNHHLADYIQTILATSPKDKYLYISHEHRDHFDIRFLESLKSRDFTLLLANYSHPLIIKELDAVHYQCKNRVLLNDNESYALRDGDLRLFIVDTELNCDSAILVKSESSQFLNLNDCKIHDRLEAIVEEHGAVDVFTAQFSGASWYPTCYEMSKEYYQIACEKKIAAKFEAIAEAIGTVKPKLYLPSAGPPCFLDPMLLPVNFQAINTYPRAAQLLAYLDKNSKSIRKQTKLLSKWTEIFPGDVLDVATVQLSDQSKTWVQESDFKSYVESYAKEYKEFFASRAEVHKKIDSKDVLLRLELELKKKVKSLKFVHRTVKTLLYWRLSEYPEQMLCISLAERTVTFCSAIEDMNNYYRITAPAWSVNKVLNQEMTWPDFALTFRMTIERVPEVYNTILHGFLILEAEKIASFCKKMAAVTQKKDRCIIEFEGKRYSIARYCPHQGGDLSHAHIEGSCLVCPVHQWQFDLKNQGKCTENETTIDAVCLGKVKVEKG